MSGPNLFVVGAPRSGTTSIASWLGQHPDVWMSVPKEPAFYAGDLQMQDRVSSRDHYLSLFEQGTDRRYRGEATPWYLYSTAAAAAIRRDRPDARIVISLRNPVDMLASLHNHHRYVGFESEPEFQAAVDETGGHTAGDFRHSLDYVGVGRVGEQVARYADAFPAAQLHFIRLDDLAQAPAATYRSLLAGLGLDVIDLNRYDVLNPARRHRSGAVQATLTRLTGGTSATGLRRSLWYRALGLNTVAATPAVEPDLRARLLELLEPDIKLLEDITGEDLSVWLTR